MDYYKKKYDEALGKAEEFYNDKDNIRYANAEGMLEEIFPELKEPEDEQIRKYLIRYIDNTMKSSELKSKLLAWLEKQSEQNDSDVKDYNSIDPHFGKSIDKVEPKFKVGDFIVNDYCMGKVVELTNDAYLLDTEQGIPFSCEHNVHLWTIQDAKDGDILYSLDSNQPFIYKERKPNEQATAYCGLNIYGKFFVWGTKDCVITLNNYVPTTKEQCDTLFAKMKEAGYEWDIEKKELKKVEDEEYNGEDYGIDSLWHAKNILEETLGKVDGYQTDDGFLSHQCAITAVKKLYKQKPTWSEEDEQILQGIWDEILANKHNAKEFEWKTYDKFLDWLKSLKDRYTWKPSEEQMKALHDLNLTGNLSYAGQGQVLIELYNGLKRLKGE